MAEFNHELLCVLSGFGGQGLLFAGKIIANCGLLDGRQVSWMPSYGPEMRGGTANCSVSLSDDAIGSPFITRPTAVIAMNQPSVEKFAGSVQPGGTVVIDTTLAMNGAEGIELAEGVSVHALAATHLAEEAGLKGLANIVCLGKLWSVAPFCDRQTIEAAIAKCVPPKRQHLLEPNLRAFQLGVDA
ncbi:MAG: 2-oxoacid:acceptor oxidoreductase family protein [Coriobacteriales bacterium]|nr:2-oxoacid:acceptor oxidoreductase family protein [Coriobacteriales bacterium]